VGSLPFDRRLFSWDIIGSLAHIDSLKAAGVLTAKEQKDMRGGLIELLDDLKKGKAALSPDLEDIHMNIEALLGEKIGSLAGKLHTGRSRNDQVALDLRLYSRERTLKTLEELAELQEIILSIAKQNLKTVMPGLTHLQPAQPVTLAHHMMAYWFKFKRDFDRLKECYNRMNFCPLGAGALAGNTYRIDRFQVANALGFAGPMENSMDAVSDRDFAVELIFCLTVIMNHISSIAEEIILWNTPQFGFINLSPELTTGSSMMPQKRNPDIAELARAKSGRVTGDLVSLLTVLKGLPLTYNRDLQEDKEPLFDAFDTSIDSLAAIRNLLSTAKFNAEKMKDACLSSNLAATDLADYLVGKGIPFRNAYAIVKEMIKESIKDESPLEKWSLAQLRKHSDLFEDDAVDFLQLEKAVERREIFGGTSASAVEKSLSLAEKYANEHKKAIEKIRGDVEGTISRLLG